MVCHSCQLGWGWHVVPTYKMVSYISLVYPTYKLVSYILFQIMVAFLSYISNACHSLSGVAAAPTYKMVSDRSMRCHSVTTDMYCILLVLARRCAYTCIPRTHASRYPRDSYVFFSKSWSPSCYISNARHSLSRVAKRLQHINWCAEK